MISLFKRLMISGITLFVILATTFLLLHLTPGGPFDQERQLPPEIENNLYQKYKLQKQGDQNFWIWMGKEYKAYFSFLKNGNLGPSLTYKDRDVGNIITTAFGPSLELGFYSLLFAALLGIFLGVLTSRKPGGIMDKFLLSTSPLLVSLPTFVIAVFLVFIFSIKFHILPPALWEGPLYRILPMITLSAAPLAYFIQLTRSGLLEELKKDYIRTAYSKGVSPKIIFFKHALKNTAIPLLTVIGPMAAYLITGSFVVETIFAIPGLGKHFVTAVINRDYFLVMGITLFYSLILITLNWAVDLLYTVVDPRMKVKS